MPLDFTWALEISSCSCFTFLPGYCLTKCAYFSGHCEDHLEVVYESYSLYKLVSLWRDPQDSQFAYSIHFILSKQGKHRRHRRWSKWDDQRYEECDDTMMPFFLFSFSWYIFIFCLPTESQEIKWLLERQFPEWKIRHNFGFIIGFIPCHMFCILGIPGIPS